MLQVGWAGAGGHQSKGGQLGALDSYPWLVGC